MVTLCYNARMDVWKGKKPGLRAMERKSYKENIGMIVLCGILLGIATGIGFLFRSWKMSERDIVIIYLLCVLVTARLTTGYIYGIAMSFLSTMTFNYLFIAPIFQLQVEDTGYLATFVVMILIAVITSASTSQIKEMASELKVKEKETRFMCSLMASLREVNSIQEMEAVTIERIKQIFHCEAFWMDVQTEENNARLVEKCGVSYQKCLVYGKKELVGYMCIPVFVWDNLNENKRTLLKMMLENLGMAADRLIQMEKSRELDEKVKQENYRANLLRSISHDIRTPLASMMGTSEMLMDMTDREDSKYKLEESIYQDAQWLCSMVENVLNLTRLQEGKLLLNKEEEALEEIIGSAVERLTEREPKYDICVELPEELVMVPMDARLIQQVLLNLLDNAVKHTEPYEEIKIMAQVDEGKNVVSITVLDRGRGILPEALPNIFQMFYSADYLRQGKRKGIGLGLAICQTIIHAHGGEITAENRNDGKGARFTFTLPMEETENGKNGC